MSTTWADEPEWFDLTGELDRIAREAGLIRDGDGWWFPSGPRTVSGFLPPQPMASNGVHLQEPPTHSRYMNESPVDDAIGNEYWRADSSLSVLQPVPPSGQMVYEDESFRSGLGGHQSAPERTSTSVHEAEASLSLAPTKPNYTEDDNQSESSDPATPDPRAGYDRTEAGRGKKQCLAQIREVLDLPSKDDLSILRGAIKHLGGTVPQHLAFSSGLTKPQKLARKRAERRQLFEALRDLVRPRTTRVRELQILEMVLQRISGMDEPRDPEGIHPYVHVTTLSGMIGGGYQGSTSGGSGGLPEAGPSSYKANREGPYES